MKNKKLDKNKKKLRSLIYFIFLILTLIFITIARSYNSYYPIAILIVILLYILLHFFSKKDLK